MKLFVVANFLALQFGWLVTVLGAVAGWPLAGPAFTAGWLGAHLYHLAGGARRIELRVVLGAIVLGYLLDSVLVLLGVMEFAPQTRLGAPTTVWMVTLWINLALTLRHSLGWLRERYLLAAVLGAFAGPLAYAAGAKLGAIGYPNALLGHSAVALEWLAALPALMVLTRWSESLDARHAGGAGTAERMQS